MAGEYAPIPQVVGDLVGLQRLHRFQHVFAAGVGGCAILHVQPAAFHRVQHQDLGFHSAFGQQHADAADHIVEQAVVPPPRLLLEQGGRIIPFTQAAQRVALQMLAQVVDAVHHLVLVDAPQLLKADIPAAQCKGLGQNLPLPQLLGNRGHLHLSLDGGQAAAKVIHAGDVHVFVGGHAAAVGQHMVVVALLQHQVAGQGAAVFPAPVVDAFHIVFGKQIPYQLPESVAYHRAVRGALKQPRQPRCQLLAVGAAVGFLQLQRPGKAVAGHLRLIGEKAAHFAEILSQHRLVYRVGGAQKCLHHLAVQGVHIEGVDLVVEMAVFAAHGDVGNGVRRMYRRRGGGAAQILLLIFFAQSVHSAAAEAARPAVFVISPGEHAAPAAFLQCCAHIGKPVCREILGLQTATGVHEIAAHAGLVHLAHLRSRFLRLQSLIPRPKGRRTVFFRRVLQGFFPVFHGVFLRFAENLTISCYHTVFSKAIGECPKN